MTKRLIPQEAIENKILILRSKKIMLDRDLATLYGVETKRINEQVKRNIKRFPDHFMFQLTKEEKDELVANCDRFKILKHSTSLPYAFTEHGVAMLSSVLNSERAIQVSIQIINVFIKMREMLLNYQELKQKIEDMEKKKERVEREGSHLKNMVIGKKRASATGN
ncbi:MAG: ORF6N domain-containing protein [bacterium]